MLVHSWKHEGMFWALLLVLWTKRGCDHRYTAWNVGGIQQEGLMGMAPGSAIFFLIHLSLWRRAR